MVSLQKVFPQIPVELYDERFTSVLAHRAILDSGISKKRRQVDKGLVDEISACIILQNYMEGHSAQNNMPDLPPMPNW